ncbi:hypothetical protein JCM17845_01020 [Iodidimonas gelatinilytica]|uniref:Uncharacterized protein n=1 Tax=Iodidimonas gelatinilytica TaxID=1236966 RepID=A0A5A7MWN3_9PROT|nr:hypothetical protein [Iodidimonas gelatinilytica]GEQ99478.1 hypothetical protein JCM17845_01020 [Iodidimonas gelatinilytica]
MSTDRARLGFSEILASIAKDIRAHAEVFVLLALLWAIINTILTAPLFDDLVAWQNAMQDDPEGAAADLRTLLPKILAQTIASFFLLVVVPVLWARALLLGRGGVFGRSLGRSYGLSLLHTLSFLLYLFAVIIGLFVLSLLLAVLGGLLGIGDGILSSIMFVLAMVSLLWLYTAYSVAVVYAALGQKRGIRQALLRMQPHWKPFAAIAVLGPVSASLFGALVVMPFLSDGTSPTKLSRLVGSVFTGIGVLIIFTAAVAVVRAVQKQDMGGE